MKPYRQTAKCAGCASILLVVAEPGDMNTSATIRCPACQHEFRLKVNAGIAAETLQVISFQRPEV